ncbi:MAG: hypothetical protein LBG10_00115 [Treponema sp.]|jgi:hypothetical protein|nr:hypothetical protein [Treponema sp.]
MLTASDEYYHGNPIVNTRRRGGLNLLALIPHRDVRKRLRAWSGELFAAGMAGAWSFPWAAPLACLSRPLSAGELRDAAFALRELTGGGDGKFWTRAPALSPFPAFFASPSDGASGESGRRGRPAVYGPRLEPGGFEQALREIAASKAAYWFSPPVLGAALAEAPGPETGTPPEAASPGPLPGPPVLSFRAAALANMLFIPLEAGDRACSFEWDIGPLRWLPPVKKRKGPKDRL